MSHNFLKSQQGCYSRAGHPSCGSWEGLLCLLHQASNWPHPHLGLYKEPPPLQLWLPLQNGWTSLARGKEPNSARVPHCFWGGKRGPEPGPLGTSSHPIPSCSTGFTFHSESSRGRNGGGRVRGGEKSGLLWGGSRGNSRPGRDHRPKGLEGSCPVCGSFPFSSPQV